jgi:hypothetical protein
MSWNNKEEIETTRTVQQWRYILLVTKLIFLLENFNANLPCQYKVSELWVDSK